MTQSGHWTSVQSFKDCIIAGKDAKDRTSLPSLVTANAQRPMEKLGEGIQAKPVVAQKRTFMSAQRFNELPKLDRFLRAGAVTVIPVARAFGRTTASAMHPADFP